MTERVMATYRFVSAERDEVANRAAAFATGQSVGTWLPLPGLTPDLVERHGARVEAVSPASDWEGDVSTDAFISFPIGNFEPGFPMLWTTLLGNDPSTGITATLVDLRLPESWHEHFAGPRLGVKGWRARYSIEPRALLLNPMKPSIGLSVEETAAIAAAAARGGMDLVKDDEVLADTSTSPVAARVLAVERALDDVAANTGHRARYVVSITARRDVMFGHADAAVGAGADGVMVAALAIGLDNLQALAEHLGGRLPILAHTAGIDAWSGRDGLGVAPDLLVTLCRLAGADAVLIGSPWARRPTRSATWVAMAERLRDGWAGIEPAFPVVGGGVVAGQLAEIVRQLGRDVIITAGGSVNGHPDGAEAGARELRAALDTALTQPAL